MTSPVLSCQPSTTLQQVLAERTLHFGTEISENVDYPFVGCAKPCRLFVFLAGFGGPPSLRVLQLKPSSCRPSARMSVSAETESPTEG